jgi:hypothetical protein
MKRRRIRITAALAASLLLLSLFLSCASDPDGPNIPIDGSPETASPGPAGTGNPEPTGEPSATANPGPTEEPSATVSPDPTEEPSAAGNPDPTEEPSATVSPDPTGDSPATSNPGSSNPGSTDPGPADNNPEPPAGPQTENPRGAVAVPMPDQPGTLTEANEKAVLDYSNSSDGYCSVKFVGQTDNALRVQITAPNGTRYVYASLKPNGGFDVYPFSEGSGVYTVEVFEAVPGSTGYSRALPAVSVNVSLKNEFAPFLRPNRYVNFTKSSQAVQKADSLVKYSQGLIEEISDIYNFVIGNITYDRALAEKINSGTITTYIPDVDETLRSGKGICFDYAALMTAMLRSRGIPCKLVMGTAGNQQHAWISVWSEEAGWINGVIQFNGTWVLMDPTFAAGRNEFTGEGTNYSSTHYR